MISKENIYFTTKGDFKLMAIGLASTISYYFSTLGSAYVQEQLNSVYKRDDVAELELLNGSSDAEVLTGFLEKIKPELREEFMNKYAKCYFGNVQEAMAAVEKA